MLPLIDLEGYIMKNKSVFITATGTDVGKTYVSALLVKKMRELGVNCGYYKPALSGAIKQNDGSLLPGDCDFVLKTAGVDVDPVTCVSYCFEEAVSPHLAAARQGIKISIDKIKLDYEQLLGEYEFLVVEGAGGITCPFDMSEVPLLLPDVIKALDLNVIIVADGGLGTINSVLLTVEYAKSRGLNILGIILNNYDKDNFMHVDNKIQIERLTGIKVITTVAKGDSVLNIEKDSIFTLLEEE